MKNFAVLTTKTAENYGVAFMDTKRDFLIRHFEGFEKRDAGEIVRFCNVVIGKIDEPMSDDCAKVIQVGNGFYVTKDFKLKNGDTLSFSSHGFKNEIAACRCGAILEMALSTEGNTDDDD